MSSGSRDRRWIALDPAQGHPLGHLAARRVGHFVIRVLVGPRSRFGAAYFRLHLEDRSGRLCEEPAILGLHSSGRHPSHNWIEIASTSHTAAFAGRDRFSIHPEGSAAGRALWQLLGDSIPPGGHMMVEYESPEWRDTEQGLSRGFPPVTTPLGHLLFRIGCGVNFKDWYYSEGLHEGPRKLQGWKALNEEHRRRRAEDMVQELTTFLSRPAGTTGLEQEARRRAEEVLSKLRL